MACRKVRQACWRFADELKKSLTDPEYPWAFDEGKAERPIAFMEKFLSPTKGDYDGLELLPWECFFEANIYGWVDRQTGLRRFREALCVVGRGNGKSTLMAGNATYGASKDGERGADVYLLANTKEQAGIVFGECQAQIRASRKLSPHFRTLRDGIHYDAAGGRIQHRASDSRKLDGLNPHMAVFDEIHEYRDFKLINVMRRGMSKRRQPLALYITTMGTVLDGPLMYYYKLFGDMLSGALRAEVSDRMFALIYELDESDDIEDSELWIKANPSIGALLKLDTLKEDWARAKNVPQERSDFINKQLNIFTNASEAAFIDYDIIKRNDGEYPLEALEGMECYGGFDLSASEDFTSAALLFPLPDGRVFVLSHTWVPQKKVELDNEKLPFYEYAMAGYLTIVEGDYIRQDDVYQWFCDMAQRYQILSIGYDPANATWLIRMLEARGFNCDVVRQGALSLNAPMKDIRTRLLDGDIVFNGNPLLRWYIGNVKLRRDFYDTEKDNWMPSKRDRYKKIDGFMAMLDAYAVYMRSRPVDCADNDSIGITTMSFDFGNWEG